MRSLADEVMGGSTADSTTLAGFLKKLEARYGKANRTWVMDRGIPTEETLALMRQSEPAVHYLVGTPKGRLSRLEQASRASPGNRCARRFRSSCCIRTGNSTSWRAATAG